MLTLGQHRFVAVAVAVASLVAPKQRVKRTPESQVKQVAPASSRVVSARLEIKGDIKCCATSTQLFSFSFSFSFT